jgi:hypothetical protein
VQPGTDAEGDERASAYLPRPVHGSRGLGLGLAGRGARGGVIEAAHEPLGDPGTVGRATLTRGSMIDQGFGALSRWDWLITDLRGSWDPGGREWGVAWGADASPTLEVGVVLGPPLIAFAAHA